MDPMALLGRLSWLDSRLIASLEKLLKKIPSVREKIETESGAMMAGLEDELKPYKRDFPTFTCLPGEGRSHAEILREMAEIQEREEARWQDGFVSGAVYHGGKEHIELLNEVYALYSQTNPLHADVWPSIAKYEAEIVAMTGHMMSGPEGVCGTVSSGGTESILLAMKTYRDWARETRRVHRPEMVVPTSAHAAFEKAADYFIIKMVRVPVGPDFRADVDATQRAINRNTVVVVGSAPSFPHGVVDPIPELSELARQREIGFHTDACLGGFILPWARRLGYSIPEFDFRLPGVTSISADTHKFGYAAKGTSVILYRSPALRAYQYYTATDWPGGLYFSPTFAGSRPGALSAACWAAMLATGESGYVEAARSILDTAAWIKEQVRAIPDLYVLGEPLFVIAFASRSLDIYRVMDEMSKRGWSLNGLYRPAAVHLSVTLRHTQPGVKDRFAGDLRSSVEAVRANPEASGGLAPIYGMAATLPLRGVVGDLLKKYIDLLYKP